MRHKLITPCLLNKRYNNTEINLAEHTIMLSFFIPASIISIVVVVAGQHGEYSSVLHQKQNRLSPRDMYSMPFPNSVCTNRSVIRAFCS
ncbi:hypothetical protein FKM82_001395 [Ascaphus truei]